MYWLTVTFLLGDTFTRLHHCVFSFFTAQCTLVQSAVLRSHVVRLSVCPSVCDVDGLWSHRLEIPSFQLGTVTLAGSLVGGKSCLSVRAIDRSTSGFPNALVFCCCCCMTESESGALKMREWKMQEWKTRHQVARVENAGVENFTGVSRGGPNRHH